MAEEDIPKTVSFIDKRLSVTREAELLQSFVRVSIGEEEEDGQSESKVEEQEVEEQKKKDGEKEVKEDISKKLLRRPKKKRSRREELYCDKDRAAAVNMGSKDIKQSLKLKRKQDRSRMLQIPEEAEPASFLALGNYEMCRGDLQIALAFISKALELNPTEKSALVARSKCYILLGQPENALKDAETALLVDKAFLRAIYQKAESLYYLGDFEHSLMYYHRGLHIRPDHEDFKLGVHKAQKAIENAIGSSCVFGRTSTPDSVKTNRTGSSAPKSRKSRLLRELGPDKEYLDNLMKNPNLKCCFKTEDDGDTIVKTIEDTVKYLNDRQEFWRQQLPAHLK